MKEFKRISVPLKYSHNIDHLFTPKNTALPTIACKDKRKNFYLTESRKWSDSYMASVSWKRTEKCIGDHFTINAISKLPAWNTEKSLFSDLGLKPQILHALQENGFLKPTKIQLFSIPVIINGFNTIIGGETGGGKTLAYVSPILNTIFSEIDDTTKDSISPKSLILAPTWELCNQISDVISSLGKYLNIQCHLLNSVKDINVDSDIIVSTPFTMNCALKSGDIKTNKLTSLVMDEADFLLGTNFSDSIIEILSKTSIQTTRPVDGVAIGSQVILCNATMPRLINQVFGSFVPLETFEKIETNETHRLIPSVSHKFIRSNKLQKSTVLITLLKAKGLNLNPSTIIFCSTNESVETVSNLLFENSINHVKLCKGVLLKERLENFDKFQKGETKILLCTDLAARGLDTSIASHVINYEFPRYISDYLHRAGRVGRVGSSGVGKVTNIISSPREVDSVRIIERAVRLGTKIPIVYNDLPK